MKFTDEEIRKLAKGESIIDSPITRKDITKIAIEVTENNNLKRLPEYAYGQGYASYLHDWFYRERDIQKTGENYKAWGIFILLNFNSNYYVIGEEEKGWVIREGIPRLSKSSFPKFESVDVFEHEESKNLIDGVTKILDHNGLVRLFKEDLSDYIPKNIEIETNLGVKPFRVFDALFHWMD